MHADCGGSRDKPGMTPHQLCSRFVLGSVCLRLIEHRGIALRFRIGFRGKFLSEQAFGVAGHLHFHLHMHFGVQVDDGFIHTERFDRGGEIDEATLDLVASFREGDFNVTRSNEDIIRTLTVRVDTMDATPTVMLQSKSGDAYETAA
jgi:hypothetical protein